MENIHNKLKEKLSLVEEMYDCIRIIDMHNKNATIIKSDGSNTMKGTCYNVWERGQACRNCISMKAYNEKETFAKLEYIGNRIFLVIATTLDVDGELQVLEMIKDISKNRKIFNDDNSGSINIAYVIDKMNEMISNSGLTVASNGICGAEKVLVDINNKKNPESRRSYTDNRVIFSNKSYENNNELFELRNRIEALRITLDEMCVTLEGNEDNKQRLEVSQYLDNLIVEYMKNNA